MSSENIYSRSYRLRKAYWTTTVVMFSYLRLWLLKKILGQSWYNKRILKLHIRNAERVRDAILELKGLFIKLGQILSILSNFLPEAFQKPLEALQDQIPPRPFETVRARILKELGKPIEELFERFDESNAANCHGAGANLASPVVAEHAASANHRRSRILLGQRLPDRKKGTQAKVSEAFLARRSDDRNSATVGCSEENVSLSSRLKSRDLFNPG